MLEQRRCSLDKPPHSRVHLRPHSPSGLCDCRVCGEGVRPRLQCWLCPGARGYPDSTCRCLPHSSSTSLLSLFLALRTNVQSVARLGKPTALAAGSQGGSVQASSKLSLPLQQWGECQQTAAMEGQRPHGELSLNPLIKSFSDAKAPGSEASLQQFCTEGRLSTASLVFTIQGSHPFSFLFPRHTIRQCFDWYHSSQIFASCSNTFPLDFTHSLWFCTQPPTVPELVFLPLFSAHPSSPPRCGMLVTNPAIIYCGQVIRATQGELLPLPLEGRMRLVFCGERGNLGFSPSPGPPDFVQRDQGSREGGKHCPPDSSAVPHKPLSPPLLRPQKVDWRPHYSAAASLRGRKGMAACGSQMTFPGPGSGGPLGSPGWCPSSLQPALPGAQCLCFTVSWCSWHL